MGRKKYPDVFEDLPQEASPTNPASPANTPGFEEMEPPSQSDDKSDDEANVADINLTLKENVQLFGLIAKDQACIITNQKTLNDNMKKLAHNQVILEGQMKNFGLSDAKQTEVQGKFDEMGIRSANKFINAIHDKCDRYIKRIESSDQAFIIFFSLAAFFGLIVVTNALVWDSRMIWHITLIISGYAVVMVCAIVLVYKYLMKDNDRRY